MNHDIPPFPFELWWHILDNACKDDGTTALSLSRASRALRDVSRFHRYRTVQVMGWEKLAALEQTLTVVPEEERQILHLSIDVPELYTLAYPDTSWDGDEDHFSDSSYDDDEDEGGDTDEEAEAETSYEFAGLSDDEAEELAAEVLSLQRQGGCDPRDEEIATQTASRDLREDFSTLRGTRNPLADLEYQAFTTLRNVLHIAAPTLKTLALFCEPYHTFQLHAILPVLPDLEFLALDMDKGEGYAQRSKIQQPWRPTPVPDKPTAPQLFPRLEEVLLRIWEEDRMAILRTLPYFVLEDAPRRHLTATSRIYASLAYLNASVLPKAFSRIGVVFDPEFEDIFDRVPFGEEVPNEDVLEYLLPPGFTEVPARFPAIHRAAFVPEEFKSAMKRAWIQRISYYK